MIEKREEIKKRKWEIIPNEWEAVSKKVRRDKRSEREWKVNGKCCINHG
jgi:hypothetical protein